MGIIALTSLITVCVLVFTCAIIFLLDRDGVDLGIPPDSPTIINLIGWYNVGAAAFLGVFMVGITIDAAFNYLGKSKTGIGNAMSTKKLQMQLKACEMKANRKGGEEFRRLEEIVDNETY
jgi:hypothetical protein